MNPRRTAVPLVFLGAFAALIGEPFAPAAPRYLPRPVVQWNARRWHQKARIVRRPGKKGGRK